MISKALHRISLSPRLERVEAIKPPSCCRMCMSNKPTQPAGGLAATDRLSILSEATVLTISFRRHSVMLKHLFEKVFRFCFNPGLDILPFALHVHLA